jgi:hypothetical protein
VPQLPLSACRLLRHNVAVGQQIARQRTTALEIALGRPNLLELTTLLRLTTSLVMSLAT